MKQTVKYEDLFRRAHRNDLILSGKLTMSVLLGLLTWYVVSMNTSNRVLNLLPAALTGGLIYSDKRRTERLLRQCSSDKDAWKAQIDSEAQEYLEKLGGVANKPLVDLIMRSPGKMGDEGSGGRPSGGSNHSFSGGGSGSSSKSMPPKPPGGGGGGSKPPKPPNSMIPDLSDIMGGAPSASKKSDEVKEKVDPLPIQKPSALMEKPKVEIPVIPQAPEPSVEGIPEGELLKSPPRIGDQQHLGLIGPTRGGKTSTLVYLLGSKPKVTYVSMKMTDQVPLHWKGVLINRERTVADADAFCDYFNRRLSEHTSMRDMTEEWFIIDEALSLKSNLESKGKEGKEAARRLQSLIVEAASLGMGVGLKLCLISQSPNAGQLGISVPDMENFTWVVACSEHLGFDKMTIYFKKLTGISIKGENAKMIKALTGFWQLWKWKGRAVLGQAPLVEVKTKKLEDVNVLLRGVKV